MPNQADRYLTDQGVRDRFGQVNPQGGKAPGGTGLLTGTVDKVSAFLEGLQKGAAEQFNLDQGAGAVFGSGMSNPDNSFGFAGQLVNYLKDKAMDIRNSEPEVKRDLQGNVIGDTGVNENLIELMRNRPDLLRK